VFGQRGIAQVAIDAGIQIPSGHFANLDRRNGLPGARHAVPVHAAVLPGRHEILLESTARAAGADIRREHEVVAVADEGDVVVTRVRAADSTYLIESRYLIGADGARSFVRAAAGIEFEGTNTTHWGFLGDVALDSPPDPSVFTRSDEHGSIMLVPLPKGGLHRIVGGSPVLPENNELTFEQFRTAVTDVAGTDFGMRIRSGCRVMAMRRGSHRHIGPVGSSWRATRRTFTCRRGESG